MRKRSVRVLSLFLTASVLGSAIPVGAEEVTVQTVGEMTVAGADHLIINQVYGGGGKSETPIQNSFIELYNPTTAAVDLGEYSLTYDPTPEDDADKTEITLTDVEIAAGSSWLLVGNAEENTADTLNYHLPEADQTMELSVSNKTYKVTLENIADETVDAVISDGTDAFAVAGDTTGALDKVSKQKSLRRISYQDTDTNADWEIVGWKKGDVTVDAAYVTSYAPANSKGEKGSEAGASQEPSYTPVVTGDTLVNGIENGDTTLDMQLTARYNSGALNADGGSLEIVEYNAANGFFYAVSGLKGQIIATKLAATATGDKVTALTGTTYDVKTLVEAAQTADGFTYGDITSVAISPDGTKLAAAIQHADYDKAGKIAVFTCNVDGTITNPVLYEAGVQPDMVTFADNHTVLTADEGEPRNGYANGATDPNGTVTILDLTAGTAVQAGFDSYRAADLTAKNILIGMVDGQTLSPAQDLEPEYISVSADGKTAYVSLQEANAIAVLDVAAKGFTGIYSVGFEDYSQVAVDLVDDDTYKASVYEKLLGARMPDGISSYEVNGRTYIVTANEGDSRDWTGYSNEKKNETVVAGSKIRTIDDSKCAGLPTDQTVMFGGRSMTIFEVTATGLTEVYDSGNDFEAITAEAFPDNFNCSNDDKSIDNRSGKKGPEPENVTVGTIDGRTYAFVAIERIGGVMAYDVTKPEYSMCVNYINSREFDTDIQGDVSPEGLCFVPATATSSPILLAACEVSGTLAAYTLTKQAADDIVVLYTNDVHNAYERSADCLGYASVAQYKKQLESLGYEVELVDNGDALQGGVIGTLSKGSYIADIMDEAGYTITIPGNHEYDFGMDTFLQLAEDHKDNYEYISCNFMDLRTNKTVFNPYKVVTYGEKKVAYIGVTTPETFTKSTPTYFQDANGNYIYGFCEGNNGQDLYDQVQAAVDAAKKEADYIVVLGHVGTDPASTPWTSTEIIANTTGIDVFLDGHSHSTIPSQTCTDKAGNNVLLTSTGTKLTSLGQMKIHENGAVTSKLVKNISMQDSETLSCVNSITEKFDALQKEVVAKSEVDLVVNDPKTGSRLVRSQETNLGDLCADAYRTLLGADIAFVNGGGVRANIKSGDITYGDIVSVHPFGNAACLIEATGQQILDALELGARAAGIGEMGGFLQVSGLTYDIDTTIPSAVVLDDKSMFVKVDGAYRVKNVMVGNEKLDLTKTYKLASHNYMLKSAGDGFSMFAGDKILQDEVLIDNQVLINYIVDDLKGTITSDSIYADPYGEGRIQVITETITEPDCEKAGSAKVMQGSEVVVEELPAFGHTIVIDPAVAQTCSKTGLTEGSHCATCGKVITAQKEVAKSAHSYETVVTKATTAKAGSIVKRCRVCKEVESTQTIAAVNSIVLAKTSYIYDAKSKKPAVTVKDSNNKTLKSGTDYTVSYSSGRKNVGRYTVTITFKGNYEGSIEKTFTIEPKTNSVKNLSAKSKSISVSWKKQTTQISGYEISYSTSSKFTAKTTKKVTASKNAAKKTISKLKSGKKYYVRIRTYKSVKVNGKTTKVYSSWSKAKSVKTK